MESATKKKSDGGLPEELIGEILSWLPANYLWPLRCVCKHWLHLLTRDLRFAKLNYDRSIQYYTTNPKPSILAISLRVGQQKANIYLATSEQTAAIKLDPPSRDNPYVYTISGICNGLLCLLVDGESQVHIWNPFTNDHITIPYSSYSPVAFGCNTFAFGFHPVTNEYKVIKVLGELDHNRKEYSSRISVYTLGIDSAWRSVQENTPYFQDTLNRPCPFVNGALHWFASREAVYILSEIVAFNLKDESFQMMGFPSNIRFDSDTDLLAQMGGLLSFITEGSNGDIQIWTMKEYGIDSSWTQLFKIGKQELVGHFTCMEGYLAVVHSDDFVLLIQNDSSEELIVYNLKTNSVHNINQFRFFPHGAYLYTGSIVSPRVIIEADHIMSQITLQE